MCLRIRKASNRNTNSTDFLIGEYRFLFSYETPVAMKHYTGHYKRENSWGPTTGRHINEFNLHCARICTEEEMDGFIKKAIVETASQLVKDKFERKNNGL